MRRRRRPDSSPRKITRRRCGPNGSDRCARSALAHACRAWPRVVRSGMSLLRHAAQIVVFAGLIALGARVAVPMVPVPMTLQTLAVLLAGAALGPVRGTAAVLLYLTLAALGLPILSDSASGLAPFSGPTAGYLFAFPPGAALVGWAAVAGRLRRPVAGFAVLCGVHLLILLAGAGWLATRIGLAAAVAAGFTPFLIGAAVKSALVLLIAWLLRRAGFRRPRV